MSEVLASRIYDIRVSNYEDSIKKVQALTAAFNKLDATKKKLNEQLQKKLEAGDNAAVDALTKRLAELEKQLAAVSKRKVEAAKESDLLGKAEKGLLSSTEAYAKAELDAIKQVKEDTKYTSALSKEKEKAAKAAEKQAAANKIEAGSYYDILNQLKQLGPLIRAANAGSNISLGGDNLSFDQAIAKFKELSFHEQAFRRQFQADSTLVGEYSSGIIKAFEKLGLNDVIKKNKGDIENQLRTLRTETQDLAQQFKRAGAAGTEAFGKYELQLRENIALQEKLEAQLKTINNTSISVGSQISKSIGDGFKNVRSQVSGVLLQYIGFQAAINKAQESIGNVKTISDQTTDLEIQLDNDAKAADHLTESLKKLDTRTTVAGLQQIADIALRAGTNKQNIESVARAVDITKTAFGKDFGPVEEGTETFAKLINIFFDDREITGDRILKIGNSIRSLANETVASVPFINDFAGRMAGLRQISNITLPDVIGLGAGFEEFKQSAEVASSSLVKIIPKLAKDIDRFAKIAGITRDEFKKLLTDNPAEALIKVSEGLVKGKGDVEAFANELADAGLDAGRVTTIIGTLGGKADVFRERIKRAGETMQQTDAITSAFDKKNNNLAATMDKVSKKFADAAASKGFQATIFAIASIIGFLLTNLTGIISILGVWTAVWAVANVSLIRTRVALIASNIAFQAQYAWLVISQTVTRGYAAAVNILTISMGRAAAATTFWGTAIKILAGPIGIILAIIGLLSISVVAFGRSMANTAAALSDYAKRQQILNEVNKRANEEIAKQTSELQTWVRVIKSSAASADTKRVALEKLIDKDERFRGVLKDQQVSLGKTGESVKQLAIDYAELERVTKQVTDSIRLQAQVQASSSLSAEKQKDVLQVTSLRQKIETEFTSGRAVKEGSTRSAIPVTKEERTILLSLGATVDDFSITTGGFLSFNNSAFERVKTLLKRKEDELFGVYENYLDVQSDLQTKFTNLEGKVQQDTQNSLKKRSETEKLTQAELQSLIDGINNQLKSLREGDPQIAALINQRESFQKRLDTLAGKNLNFNQKGSQLSFSDKEQFKDIDAKRDEDLANEKLLRAQNLTDEETYLKSVLRINEVAIDAKLKLLKGSNAQERKVMSELKLDRITQEQETNNKIFEERKKVLKATLDEEIKDLQESNRLVQDDVSISNTDKAKKKQQTDESIYNLTLKYGTDIEVLEKQFGQQSIQNAKEVADSIREIKEDLRKDEKESLEAQLKDATDAGEKDIANFKKTIEAQRLAIVTSNKPQKKKDVALDQLKKEEDFGVLAREVARNTIEKEIYEKLLKSKIITQQEYDNFLAESYKKEQELHDAGVKNTEKSIEDVRTLGQVITNKVSRIFGFDDGTDAGKAKEKLLAETISQSYQLAENAMNSFFDSERANVDRNKQIIEKRIDQEKEQRLAQATSQAEREAIEREAQVKKDKADREAFEKNKKIQLAQAKINLGIQLANLAVIAFAPNPANIATLGTAGAIMYAIQAAIAFANFGANVKRISSAQYAGGGKIKPEDVKNGRITVESNIPTQPNGDNILATVKKGEVILNEEQQARIGGPAVFKSVGVPGFAGGGYIDDKKMYSYSRGGFTGLDYSGALGSNLQAPFNPSAFLNPKNGGSSADMQELKLMVGVLTENIGEVSRNVHERIDNLRVVNDPVEAAKVNDKIKKLKSIGKLR